MALEDNYNENNVSPLTAVMLTVLIGGLVWLGASFFDNLTDYGTQPKPDPVNLMASGSTEENFYSPGRAKRRANFFLRRQGDETEISSEEKALLEEEDRTKERDREDRAEGRLEQRGALSGDELVKSVQPSETISGWGESSGSVSAVSPVAPDGLKLSGIMLGSGAGIAVIDYNGTSYTKSEGQKVGRYTVAKIMSDRVVVEDGLNSFTLGLSSSSSSSDSVASVGGRSLKNGHPILPDPGLVPPPPAPGVTAKTSFKSDKFGAAVRQDYGDDDSEIGLSSSSSAPVPSKIDVYDLTQERRAEEEKKNESLYSSKSSTQAKVKLPKADPTPVRPTREEIEKYLQRGAAIISEIKVQPDSSGLGVKVKFVQEDNVLHRLGIKDGDVITRVNNKTILNSEELFNSVLNISEMPFVNIEYKRQGQTGTLIYDL